MLKITDEETVTKKNNTKLCQLVPPHIQHSPTSPPPLSVYPYSSLILYPGPRLQVDPVSLGVLTAPVLALIPHQ